MGLMNAIGLQPRHPAPSVTSQGTQTPIVQLQNAETQTERELPEPGGSQPAPRNCCTRHSSATSCLCWRSVSEGECVSSDVPPGAPTTAAAASQSSVQTEASAGDSAPSGGAGNCTVNENTDVKTAKPV